MDNSKIENNLSKDNGLVSIIMPSYNTGKIISESIQSVIEQVYSNWELIIVDDCSTDNTDEIVSRFLYDGRIKYLKNKTNSGAAVSRNRALSLAKGKWIAFLDSDDLWTRDKLIKQISFMKNNNIHFSYTNYEEINEFGSRLNIKVTGPSRIDYNLMSRFCWIGCLSVMYDANYIGLIQIEDIKKNNDYAMWLKISKKADCFLLDEYLGFYRRGRKGSISTHSYFTLIRWHYKLWHESEKYSILCSYEKTIENIIFGVLKKIIFTKRT